MSSSITRHRHRRRGVVALTLAAVLVAGTAACSSTTEVTDPTTTVQAGAPDELPTATSPPGTAVDEDDDGPGTTRRGDDGPDEDPNEDPNERPTGDETAQDYADALVASYDSSSSSDEVFSRDVVECVSPIWVDAIGVETFQDAGIAPADIADGSSDLDDITLDQAAAEAIVDSLPVCGLALFDLFVDGLGSRVSEDPAKLACVEGAVSEAQIRAVLIDQIRGEETSDPEDLVAQCLI